MKEVLYRDAIKEAMQEEMERDNMVFLMGEDVAIIGGVYKTSRGLLEQFGKDRVRNTPISESAIVSCAVGAAMAGARPIAEIMYIDFTGCCMDSIANQMAKIHYHTGGSLSVPMVLRTQGGLGKSNGSQQSQSLESWFTHLPGLKVVMPATSYDAKGLLKASIRDNNPVIFIENKGLYQTKGQIPEEEYVIPLGKADIKKVGSDVSIIAYSKAVITALEAAKTLEQEGISVEIIDLRTLVPLDFEAIAESVKKTGKVIVMHDSCERGGYGAEITAQIQRKLFDYLDAPIIRLAGKNVPPPFAPYVEKASVPVVADVIAAVKDIL